MCRKKAKMKTPQQTTLQFPADHPRPGTPTWVTQELTRRNRTTQRTAHLTTCPTCAAIILTGYDEDTAAIRATADPTILTPTQATIHTIAGRTIYHLATTPAAYRLYRIDNPNHPPPVLTNHQCHHPPPGKPLLTPPARTDRNTPPPF